MRTLTLLLLATSIAAAQDMPLHEILRPGEDWKPGLAPFNRSEPFFTVDPTKKVIRSLADKEFPIPVQEPTCCFVALRGSTLLVGDAAGRYVWAFRIEKDRSIGPGDRYCRLRVNDSGRSETSALTVDRAGRFYAATNLGIQVFDPTGRLCGVMTTPPGKVELLGFGDDRLVIHIGKDTFSRRLLARGPE